MQTTKEIPKLILCTPKMPSITPMATRYFTTHVVADDCQDNYNVDESRKATIDKFNGEKATNNIT